MPVDAAVSAAILARAAKGEALIVILADLGVDVEELKRDGTFRNAYAQAKRVYRESDVAKSAVLNATSHAVGN